MQHIAQGLPTCLCGKDSACRGRRCKRCSFDASRVGKLPWRQAWNPLQCSGLEKPTDRAARWASVHGVAKSRSRLTD